MNINELLKIIDADIEIENSIIESGNLLKQLAQEKKSHKRFTSRIYSNNKLIFHRTNEYAGTRKVEVSVRNEKETLPWGNRVTYFVFTDDDGWYPQLLAAVDNSNSRAVERRNNIEQFKQKLGEVIDAERKVKEELIRIKSSYRVVYPGTSQEKIIKEFPALMGNPLRIDGNSLYISNR